MYGSGVDVYRQTNVLTADPKRLVIVCYEGAIDNVKVAKVRYQAGQHEAKAKALQRAYDIIAELSSSLDFKKGGQIAKNLERLYAYMNYRLVNADLKRDLEGFDEIISMLEELKEVWEQIFHKDGKGAGRMPPTCHAAGQSNDQTASMGYGPRARP